MTTMTFRRFQVLGLTAILCMMIVVSKMNAQLTQPIQWKDRYVTLSAANDLNKKIARPTQSTYTVVVWERHNGDESKIMAQKIDNTNGLPQWIPEDGVEIAEGSAQYHPRSTYDTLGNVYVVWEQREKPDQALEVYIQSLNLSTGQLQWGTQGIRVSIDDGMDSYEPETIGDALGAWIAYTDTRYGVKKVNIQYYDDAGNTLIPSNSTISPSSSIDNYMPVITTDGVFTANLNQHMGVYVGWFKDSANGTQVYATQVDLRSTYTTRTVNWVSQTNNWSCTTLAVTETGPVPGDLISSNWPPMGAVFAYAQIMSGSSHDIIAAYLDWSGYRRAPGSMNRTDVSSIAEDQISPTLDCQLVRSGETGSTYTYYCYIAWEDSRNTSATSTDVYYNSVNISNMVLSSANGLAVCTASANQIQPNLEVFDNGTSDPEYLSICWTDYRNGEGDVYMQRWDLGNGGMLYPTNGFPVTRGTGQQSIPEVGKNVFVYEDARRGDPNIYAQLLGGTDASYGPSEMSWRGEMPFVTPNQTAIDYNIIMDSMQNTYVTWASGIGANSYQVYVQKMDANGTPLWQNGGIPVGDGGSLNSNPDICLADTNGVFVTWETSTGLVQYMFVSKNGIMGTRYTLATNSHAPAIAETQGGAHIVYTTGNTVHVYFVNSSGTMTDRNVSQLSDYRNGAKIVRRGATDFYVVSADIGYLLYAATTGTFWPIWLYDIRGFDIAYDDYTDELAVVAHQLNGNLAVCHSFHPSVRTEINNDADYPASGMSITLGPVNIDGYRDVYTSFCTYDDSQPLNKYQVRINGQTDDGMNRIPIYPVPAPTLDDCYNVTATDIVYMPSGIANRAMVVWAGNGNSMGTAVKAQYVDFTLSPDPALWAGTGQFVSAAELGNIEDQRLPIIQTNSMSDAPSVFMFDGRDGSRDLLLGARIYDLNGAMYWMKNLTSPVGSIKSKTFSIENPYPLPYSLSSGNILIVPFVSNDDMTFDVRLYNMLGMEMFHAELSTKAGIPGQIAIDPAFMRSRLLPGSYILKVMSPSGIQSTTIIVTK